LYLSGTVANEVFRPTRGALGEVLPESLRAMFARAGAEPGVLTWVGEGGRLHEIRAAD
jgi:hypothetical protein